LEIDERARLLGGRDVTFLVRRTKRRDWGIDSSAAITHGCLYVSARLSIGTWNNKNDPWAVSNLPLVRKAFEDELIAAGEPWIRGVELVRSGRESAERVLAWGYIWNAVTILSLAGAIISACALPLFVVRTIRAARFRRGLCPICAFDRIGIAPHVPCPECGTEITLSPAELQRFVS
jgi:hypothetical protein